METTTRVEREAIKTIAMGLLVRSRNYSAAQVAAKVGFLNLPSEAIVAAYQEIRKAATK